MRLARKVALFFLVPFVVLLLCLGYRAAAREIDIYRSEVAADMILAGEALRPTFREIWAVEGEARALSVLAAVDTSQSGMRVHWIPREVGAGGAFPPSPKPVIRFVSGSGTVDHVSVSVPIETSGVPAGAIELSRSLDREAQLVRDVAWDKAIVTAGALIGAILVALFVGVSFIGRPVRALARQAHRIGQGDLSQRLSVQRNDEIGELAQEMDRMCDQLAEARQRLADEAEIRLRTVEQLRHSDRLSTVGKLAAGLAHELGTPLNVVAGRAKMISAGRLTPEGIVENATIIRGQTARMATIIRGLLDFARRGAAKKRRVDLREIALETLALLTPLSMKRDVTLKLAEGTLPEMIEADAGQMQQVLTNLVVNAIDATEGGGSVTVRIGEDDAIPPADHEGRPGRYVRLDVEDRGTGIRKEDLPHVFEPFFTTKGVGDGTGLGLSVAHGIVRDHGGWIGVESEVLRGSCFSLYLPVELPR